MNTIKKKEIIGAVFVLIFGTLWHFAYEWTGNSPLVGTIAPVNESTWEHLKLLFTPFLLCTIAEYFLFGKKIPSFWLAKLKAVLLGMLTITATFYTYTGILGFRLLAADILLFTVSILVAFTYSYKHLKSPKECSPKAKWLGLLGMVVLTVLFVVFSFYPPQIGLFYCPESNIYGMPV